MKDKFTMIDDNGKEIEYDVLFTFENDETKKNYIVYTDQKKDDKGNMLVYASIYNKDKPRVRFESIKTEKEWKVIETILDTLQDEINEKQST